MTASKIYAGASGHSYKEWKGDFYPEGIKPDAMLAYYAERLPTVEINNTFYRMPKKEVLENWASATPKDFRFAIKASRRITHMARLKADEAADSVAYLYKNLAALGARRGPVLFQLPPFLKKDLPRFTAFLALLPKEHRAAFEFRNRDESPSAADPETLTKRRLLASVVELSGRVLVSGDERKCRIKQAQCMLDDRQLCETATPVR